MPTFSILVPVYNHERYIGAALDSLLSQTDPDWEAVVVDDGSTDGTPGIVDDYARRDRRIRAIHKANGGVSTALNVGLGQSRGAWIGWLSSDDLFEPHKLALHREWFGTHPAGRFFFTDFRTLDEASGRLGTEPLLMPVPEARWRLVEMLRGIFINGITMCAHRSVFERVGGFDERLRYAQDYDLWLRVLVTGAAVHIPDRTAITRLHARQVFQVNADVSLYDCGRASVAFLNGRRFEALFPGLDMEADDAAEEALVRAVEIAAAGHAYMYAMGAHPGLIRLVVDWVKGDGKGRRFAGEFGRRARGAALSMAGTPLGHVWRGAAVALEASAGSRGPGALSNLNPSEVCRGLWRWKRARGERVEPTTNYLRRMGEDVPGDDEGTAPGGGAEVLVADPAGESGWRTTAAKLARAGHRVLYAGPDADDLNIQDGVLTVGVSDTWRTAMALAAVGPFDAAGGPPGTRILRWPVARRVVRGDASAVAAELEHTARSGNAWPKRLVLRNSAAKWGARLVRRVMR